MRLLYIPTNRGRGEKKQGLREREKEVGWGGGGRLPCCDLYNMRAILVPRGRNPFGQHQGSRPLAGAKNHGLIVKSGKSDWLKIQSKYSAHVQKIGSGERSRSLVLTKRIAGPSGVKCGVTSLVG